MRLFLYTFYWVLSFLYIVAPSIAQSSKVQISDDYQRFGLKPNATPAPWEDGMRTSGGKDSYEWWYLDADLEDGSKAVIIFYTKEFTRIKKPLRPIIRVTINKPDGGFIQKNWTFEAEQFTASKDSCNVTIGKNYFRGNLKQYEIHIEEEGFELTAQLQRSTQSWRPKTGHITFGPDKDQLFNWVVAVPKGAVKLTYTNEGTTTMAQGAGYHDHNWGNVNMMDLFHHWYWSRTAIGPYNIIAAQMVATKDFGYEPIQVFHLSKNGQTIADDGEQVTLYRSLAKIHPKLKKDISDNLVFVYDNPQDEYRYAYYLFRETTILESDMLEVAVGGRGFVYGLARLLTGFDGAYFRFAGRAELHVYKGDTLIETHKSNQTIWELMYFGKMMGRKGT